MSFVEQNKKFVEIQKKINFFCLLGQWQILFFSADTKLQLFKSIICIAFEGEKSGQDIFFIKAQHAIPAKVFEIQIQTIFMTNFLGSIN